MPIIKSSIEVLAEKFPVIRSDQRRCHGKILEKTKNYPYHPPVMEERRVDVVLKDTLTKLESIAPVF